MDQPDLNNAEDTDIESIEPRVLPAREADHGRVARHGPLTGPAPFRADGGRGRR